MTPKKKIKTFSPDQIAEILEQKGIQFHRVGREIEADCDGTGHCSYKINPAKGLYLDAASGKGGTIAALLRRLQIPGIAPAAIAASPRPAEGGHQGQPDTRAAALRLWMHAWTCTHADDMPSAWNRGLSSKGKMGRRVIIERERDAARTYMQSRFGGEHLDHWMRQVRISDGGTILVPMQSEGAFCGVQRTYLDHSGNKIERKMLGRRGFLPIRWPAGVKPLDLGIGRYRLIGEGFETDGVVVQAAGQPGVCTFDAAGIRRWADEQAKAAERLSEEQKAAADAAVILVDEDESQTGQKAAAYAVTVLRRAGLRAFFAMPPSTEDGGPKGDGKSRDWGDYVREGIPDDVLRAHLSAAVATGDVAMAPYLPDDVTIRSIIGVRDAKTPRLPTKTLTVERGRGSLTKLVDRFVARAKAWQRGEGEPPRLGLEITFGMGKSTAIKRIIKALKAESIVTVIVAKGRNEASEYQAAGAWWRHGREDMTDAGGFDIPWHCTKAALGAELRETEHMQAAALCGAGHCEHGNLRAIRIADERGKEPPEHALQFFRDLPHLRKSASDHCWADHQAESQHQTVIVVTAQGFGPQDAVFVAGDERIPRLIMVDEGIEFAHSAFAHLDHLTEWLNSINNILKKDEDNDNLRRLYQAFEVIGQELGAHAHTGGAYIDAPAIVDAVKSLDFAKAYRKESVGSSGRWELPQWERWTTLLSAPLRAAKEIADAADNGTISIVDGRLFLTYRNPIAELISGHAVLLADATLSPTAKAMLQANEGEIYRVIGEQQLDLAVDPARFHAAPRRNRQGRIDEEDIAGQVKAAERIFREWKSQYGPSYILMQKPKALRLLARVTGMSLKHINGLDRQSLWELTIRGGIGWWGWHDRAHNSWAGWNPILFDQPAVPRTVLGQQWETHRALLIRAGTDPATIPHYQGNEESWISGQWICTGEQEQQSRAGIYQDPTIQAFFQEIIDDARLQGLGRARALNQPADQPLHGLVCGGWPLATAPMHGLTIQYLRVSAQSNRESKGIAHDGRVIAFHYAAGRLIAQGGKITREALQRECRATGTDGMGFAPVAPRNDTYSEWLDHCLKKAPYLARYLATTGPRAEEVRAVRRSLEKFGTQATKVAIEVTDGLIRQGTDIAWAALDQCRAEALDPAAPVEYQAIILVLDAALCGGGSPPACS
ncbi:toprim domain-containing protein [Acidithiobacillus sp. AC3]